MATNRESAHRRAEKLLKQGRLEAAITEYVQAVEEQPRDWATVNILGDLYAKAGQVEAAVQQYQRVADHFAREGFYQKAAALCKKIVKIKPQDERVLLQLADLSEVQGLVADAKSCLSAVAETRRRRGDRRGSAEVILRLAGLDPADSKAAHLAARAAAELGDAAGAAERFRVVGVEFLRRGRKNDGLKALQEGLSADPDNDLLRATLVEAALDAGQPKLARRYMSAADDADDATSAPTAAHANPDADPPLLRAERELRAGRVAEGRQILSDLLQENGACRAAVFSLGQALTDVSADAAFPCIDLACDVAVLENDFKAATSALRSFIGHVPDHVPALMKLIEIAVDGSLDAITYATQAQLADAFLATGRASEARVIAEDLLAREPSQPVNVDRLRRVLVALGEADPDGIIAGCLTGESPFAVAGLWDDRGPKSAGSATPAPAAQQAVEQTPDAADGIELAEDAEIELDFRVDADSELAAVADGEIERVFDEWLKRPPASDIAAPPPISSEVEPPPEAESLAIEDSAVEEPASAVVEPEPASSVPASSVEETTSPVETPELATEAPALTAEEPAVAVEETEVPVDEPAPAVEAQLLVTGESLSAVEEPADGGEAPALTEDDTACLAEPPLSAVAEAPLVPIEAHAESAAQAPGPPGPAESEVPDVSGDAGEMAPVRAEHDRVVEPQSSLIEPPAWGWAVPEPLPEEGSESDVEPLPAPAVMESLEALADLGVHPTDPAIRDSEIVAPAIVPPEASVSELPEADLREAAANFVQPAEEPADVEPVAAEDFAVPIEPILGAGVTEYDEPGRDPTPSEPSMDVPAQAGMSEAAEADIAVVIPDEAALGLEQSEPGPITESATVDLSVAIGALRAGVQPAGGEAGIGGDVAPPVDADDLDRVFAMFRDEAALRGLADTSEQHLKLAAAYRDIGMIDECIGALEVAARSPRHRFEAASLLADTLRGAGRTREAVEWFERAAEAPAPSAEAGRGLLYELAATLSDVGETERALAVFLELQADAPDYRDVAARVRRLSSVT